VGQAAEVVSQLARRGEDPDGTSPVVIVAGTLLAVVLLSFAVYSVGDYRQDLPGGGSNLAQASGGTCGQGAPDHTYTVSVAAAPDPPRPERTTFLLSVRQEGRLVTGAKVCVTADMPEMQHPGLNTVATEAPGGRYEAVIHFGMGGNWRTAVTIVEPGRPIVSVPLTIPVEEA